MSVRYPRRWIWLTAAALWLVAAAPSFPQLQRGQVRLEVCDAAGAPMAAQGEIVSEGNDFHRAVQVPPDGNLLVQDLPFGVYRLSLESVGFAPWTGSVEVHSVVPIKLSVALGVAPLTTQVRVEGEPTLVDPGGSSSLFTIGPRAIHENLAAQPGRDLMELTASQPGWVFEANGVLHPRGSEYDVQFEVDGQPLTQNRSPAFAPDMDSDEVESLRIMTAGFPAEYGRKLGGVVAVTTDRSSPMGWHGGLEAGGGSYDAYSGSAGLGLVTAHNRFSARISGLHSDRYLDPPVAENFSNSGNSSGILADYEHDFGANDRLRVAFLHDTLDYIVPNDLTQQNQPLGPQRQDAGSDETGGQLYYQHSISADALLSVAGGVRSSSFSLRSNILSTPVIVDQDRGYTEAYARADLAVHKGHHEWKIGVDSFFTPVHEALAYHITDPSQFDPGTQINFAFRDNKWDVEPSFFVQDQMHYGNWNFGVGLRLDYYSFVVHKVAASPRISVGYYVAPWDLLLHASYDRVFQTPAMENLLLASSPELDSVSPEVLRVPVPPAQGNFFEAGFTKSFAGKVRVDGNVFRRNLNNYADDDVLLQTGVSFPIAYKSAVIQGEEVRIEVPHWGRFSGYVSYSNQTGLGQGPITGGLFIGSDASGVLTDTSKFAVSQDQRNTLRTRVRCQATSRLWFAAAVQYGSGLPVEIDDDVDLDALIAQYGEKVVSRVNFDRGRVLPSWSLDLGMGADLYRRELRALQFQLQATNVTNQFNVINFASLFSGTAVSAPQMVTARLRFSF